MPSVVSLHGAKLWRRLQTNTLQERTEGLHQMTLSKELFEKRKERLFSNSEMKKVNSRNLSMTEQKMLNLSMGSSADDNSSQGSISRFKENKSLKLEEMKQNRRHESIIVENQNYISKNENHFYTSAKTFFKPDSSARRHYQHSVPANMRILERPRKSFYFRKQCCFKRSSQKD